MIFKDDVKLRFEEEGFVILNNAFPDIQLEAILTMIESVATDDAVFRKSRDLFAIRQVLKVIPELQHLIFTNQLCNLLIELFGFNYSVVKSIYFDKPAASNWAVPYHQDLTISIDKKVEIEGYNHWTVKQNQYAVQPPVALLQNNFTVRIHLDDTDENNGALKVISGSHRTGIIRTETLSTYTENEHVCRVEKGGIMLMRPLLLHASNRTTNGARRRVIHIEFSSSELPVPLQWSEYLNINSSCQLH